MEKLISFETAILADEEYFRVDNDSIKGRYFNEKFYPGERTQGILCTTQSVLQEWIRKEYDIHICICIDDLNWNYQLYNCSEKGRMAEFNHLSQSFSGYDTFENALESGLQKALLYIKENFN